MQRKKCTHLPFFLWIGPWVVYEWCQFYSCAENIERFSDKAVLTNFFICANSYDDVLSTFAFEFQMAVKLQEFVLCEWDNSGRCQQNYLAAFHLFILPSFLQHGLRPDTECNTVKCCTESANPARSSDFYEEKVISC